MTGVGQEVEETKEARPRDWSAVLSALFVVREYVKLYAALSAVFLLSTIAIYALVPPTYTAEATIGPPGPSPTDAMLIQQIGGAGIAANLLGGAGVTSRSDPYQEFIQLLQDSRLARVLIEKDHLLPTIFYRAWDSDAKGWKPRWPTHYVTDAAKTILQRPIYPEPEMDQLTDYLSDHLTVSKIDSGARSLIETDGFQRISFAFENPDQAKQILNTILAETDNIIRDDQRRDVTARIIFLRRALSQPVISADERTALISILSYQEQLLAVIQADHRFAITLVTPPYASLKPTFPPAPILAFVLATITSAMVWVALVLFAPPASRIRSLVERFRWKRKA